MFSILLFNGALLVSCGYAAWRGGAPERIAAAAFIIAAAATLLAPWHRLSIFHDVNWPVLWIDIALLAALVGIALLADRYWPMWAAAIQLITVATHGVRAYDPTIWALAYWAVSGKIAYLLLLLLLIGTVRHRTRQQAGSLKVV